MDQLFFHGSVPRAEAEAKVQRGGNGVFLIRQSSSDSGSYVLSVGYQGEALHFKIKNEGECWFSIDEGPVFEGLADLTEHFVHFPDGLPCNLTSPVLVRSAEIDYKEGNTKLHTACAIGDRKHTAKNLKPDVACTKNAWGRIPLHEACRNAHKKCIQTLLEKQPQLRFDINARDKLGWTPLHLLAERGTAEIVLLLISYGADVTVINNDGETPRQVASRVGNTQTCRVLSDSEEGYGVPEIKKLFELEYYHGKLNRVAAENIITIYGSNDGLFLVRFSKGSGNFILSMCFNQSCFHFQIQCSQAENCYFIDDGPGFTSLGDLIQHYRLKSDGLPCVLTRFCKRSARSGGLSPDEEDIYQTGNLKAKKPRSKPVRASTYEEPGKKIPPARPKKKKSMQSRPLPDTPQPQQSKDDYDKMAELDELMKRQELVGVKPGKLNSIPYHDIELGDELGAGEFGKVYRGTYKSAAGSISVAVKTLQADKINGSEDFLREAKLMSALKHPNVVILLGVVQKPMLMIVQELVSKGALNDYLAKEKGTISNKQRLRWASEVANGMNYLEKVKYVHRDLATRNILLTNELRAKISDFGLSRAYEDNYYQASAGGRWPVRWYALECIHYGKFTSQSDVWSFGVTLWEIWTDGDMPYGTMNGQQIVETLQKGKRLGIPKDCPPQVGQIMKSCWMENYEERPTFASLLRKFTKLLRIS
uniref:non-specific protein-tyrosine kinase n=1 Tax=Hartaetosiga gracilis TaxID=216892 RepID=B3XVX7_9EUKA|nr:protein tyrosine kinase HTK16 [Hartaetosiga gracilis]|eukprot:m.70805 g.70805  ORF g.70805 m.70805 type:complete len:704 (-) comp11683_c0_seq1:118-2229(-)